MAETAPVCDFGWRAVDAHLPGTDGRRHQIYEQAGPGGLVVFFMCNHCPYVKSAIGRIVRDARELRNYGIGFVAINANDASTHPEDSFEKMQAFAREHGIDFPYLHDEEQHVAKAYGAVCTPDFFGFNADLKLQYRGRLDAARAGPARGAANIASSRRNVIRTFARTFARTVARIANRIGRPFAAGPSTGSISPGFAAKVSRRVACRSRPSRLSRCGRSPLT